MPFTALTTPARLIYLGLYAQQHHGQESAGIVVSDGTSFSSHKAMGLVSDVFKDGILENLKGNMGIGHVRYSTTGSSLLRNAQPFLVEQLDKVFALGHNGNIVNIAPLRRKLESKGAIFQTTTDSELIAHLVLHKQGALEERLIKAFDELRGAWSLVFLTPQSILAARDPSGIRPLCIGRKGDAIVFASETCALDIIEAEYVRDVEPGEIVIADHNGLRSVQGPRRSHPSVCVFEYIYFSRPDSMIFGHGVYNVRKQLGLQAALESPVEGADLVVPMPAFGQLCRTRFCPRQRSSFRVRCHPESLRGSDFYSAFARGEESGRQAQAQSGPRNSGRQEGRGGGRFHSERHHQQTQDSRVAGSGRQGNSHEGELPAHTVSLFLRDRFLQQRRADRMLQHGGASVRLHWSRLLGLSQS